MKIKVINFVHKDKPMHLRADAELGLTVDHLQKKYGDIQIHSIYPDNGPMIKFSPMASPKEFVTDKYFRCVLAVSGFLFCLVVAYILVKEGVYKHQ